MSSTFYALQIIILISFLPHISFAAEKIDIISLIWKNRILMTNQLVSGEFASEVKIFEGEKKCEMAERRIKVIVYINNENPIFNIPKFAKNRVGIWLIGYDGKQKYFNAESFEGENVFDIIDLMPMRQSEINNSHRSCRKF